MNRHTGRLISRATGLAATLLVFTIFCTFAQVIPSGSLDGEIRDATGALLPGTTVVLTNLSTGVAQTVATNEAGTYLFNLVPIGQYRWKQSSRASRSMSRQSQSNWGARPRQI